MTPPIPIVKDDADYDSMCHDCIPLWPVLVAVSWFFLQPSGWRCVDLLYSDWTRKPVYKEWAK